MMQCIEAGILFHGFLRKYLLQLDARRPIGLESNLQLQRRGVKIKENDESKEKKQCLTYRKI